MVVLPKSVTPKRIEDNLKTVQLDSEDLEALAAIHKEKGTTRFVYRECHTLQSPFNTTPLTFRSCIRRESRLPGQAIERDIAI